MSENKNGNHRFGSDNVLDRGIPHGHPANAKMAPSKNFKVEVSLWLARLKIILLVLFYMLPWPIFGDLYYKILLANSAASFICVQLRLSCTETQYLTRMLRDDRFHNALYSVILFHYPPLPYVWLPIFLFSFLQVANHPWFDKMDESGLIGRITSFVESQSIALLRIIAVTEILILALIPFHLQGWTFRDIELTLFTIFWYHKFLTMRFHSKLNPFTRIVLSELRDEIENIALEPSCPRTLRTLLLSEVTSLFTPRVGGNELQHFICSEKPLFGKNSFLSGLA
ncbi:transmembrane protein 33-like [Daphnia pulex]|uniref:transmembrane protein 33-like n=1 Tax=Daphnia pulex TaxID=6669 RepID=UPI001EDE3DC7|nr:transmembrane protein 33-like [Daphnia pulex]